MHESKPSPLVGVILLALAALLGWGLLSFASPCNTATADASSGCHWAHRVLLAMDGMLGVISLVRVFELDEGERRGLSFCAALTGALIAATPGLIIALCQSPAAACQARMRPFTLAVGIAVAVVGGTDLVRRLLAIGKQPVK